MDLEQAEKVNSIQYPTIILAKLALMINDLHLRYGRITGKLLEKLMNLDERLDALSSVCDNLKNGVAPKMTLTI